MSVLTGRSVIVPLVTPLDSDGRVDAESFERLIDFQIAAGVDGFLVLGSCGEAAALGAADRRVAAQVATRHVGDRAHVMVGVSTVNTHDVVDEAVLYDAMGAHSLLATAPVGLDLSDAEMVEHYLTVQRAVGAPVLAYDVPSRVHARLGPVLVSRLAHEGAIAGVKDSTGDLNGSRHIAHLTSDLDGFVRYTGSEECIDAVLLGGFDGTIPGLANVFPQLHVALVERIRVGDWDGAARIQQAILPLLDLYAAPIDGESFSASFFFVVKQALVELGVLRTATASRPFAVPGKAARSHVVRVLERGLETIRGVAAATGT